MSDELPAGRELDAIVAEKVMGCKVSRITNGRGHVLSANLMTGDEELPIAVHWHSTSIEAAFEVFDL